jgi:hypothetical protein
MFTRPPLRAVLATTAAAGLLVGGANLASYAATHHGHSSGTSAKPHAQPKTIAYHLGSPGQAMGNTRLFSAKVPKGTYEVSISGWLSDDVSTTGDSVTCVLADKKALFHLLNHPGSLTGAQRFYAITGGSEDKTYDFAVMDNSNPVAKIDRRNISYGCLLSGGPFHVVRPLVFTLKPVSVSNKKGHALQLTKSQVGSLHSALR